MPDNDEALGFLAFRQRVLGDLQLILENQGVIMAAIDDLNAAVTALGTAVTNEGSEITTLIADIQAANAAGGNNPAIEAAAQAILANVATMNAAVTAAQTATAPVATAGVTGSTTSGSPVVTVSSSAGVTAGQGILGANIPAGATVMSVDSPTQVTMTLPATATAAGVAITFD